jgi:hypothetical protein
MEHSAGPPLFTGSTAVLTAGMRARVSPAHYPPDHLLLPDPTLLPLLLLLGHSLVLLPA